MAPLFSRKVEEATVEVSGSTSLRNSTDGNIRKNIDYINKAHDKDKSFNTLNSWRLHVTEYNAMCFSIYGTERVPELMTMEKAYNFLFL
jgi:3-deoxy-D-arabino-heptulosonate 7-phosphate (DAHP) synthase